MGWLDRFRRPQPPPPSRQRRRQPPTVNVRRFAAAETNRQGEVATLIGDTLRPVDADIRAALARLRRKARTEFESSSDARRAVALLRRNVVGSQGIALSIDHPAGDDVLDAFAEHSRQETFTTNGRLSRAMVEGLVINGLAIDGEFLCRWRGTALELLDAHQIPIDAWDELKEGREVVMGVRLDARQRPTGYLITAVSRDHGGYLSYQRGEARRMVNASDVLHIYQAEFPRQTRGWPMLNTALDRLAELRQYERAELEASIFASRKYGFLVRSETGDRYTGDDVDDDGTQVMTDDAFTELPYGVEAKPLGWDHPTQAFADFTRSHRRAVAGALDVEAHDLSGDYASANFSSLRAARLAAQEGYQELQALIIERFTRPVFAKWLRAASLEGTVPGVTPATYLPILAATQFSGRRWANLQPREHARGQQLRLALGLTSLSEEIRSEGRDPARVLRERQADRERLEAAGLPTEVLDNVIPLPGGRDAA